MNSGTSNALSVDMTHKMSRTWSAYAEYRDVGGSIELLEARLTRREASKLALAELAGDSVVNVHISEGDGTWTFCHTTKRWRLGLC